MTIVVGVAAPDGIILAGDSRTTVTYGERHRIMSDYSQKVFSICDTIGIATYGIAFLGERTIAGLMDEFVAQRPDEGSDDSHAIAEELGQFFDEKLREVVPEEEVNTWVEQGFYPLGFLVAGYDSDGIGRIREVAVPGPYIEEETDITTAALGVAWRGQTDVIRRLIKGFDRDLFAALGSELPENLEQPVANLEYRLLFPITMQDAVDLASFLIRTTIDMQRFSDGTIGREGDVPGCGGPVRFLAITRERTEWVEEAPLRPATTAGIAEGGAAV